MNISIIKDIVPLRNVNITTRRAGKRARVGCLLIKITWKYSQLVYCKPYLRDRSHQKPERVLHSEWHPQTGLPELV